MAFLIFIIKLINTVSGCILLFAAAIVSAYLFSEVGWDVPYRWVVGTWLASSVALIFLVHIPREYRRVFGTKRPQSAADVP